MNPFRCSFFALLMICAALPARSESPFEPAPGGDVLRPGGRGSKVFLGLDAGLSFSYFMGDLTARFYPFANNNVNYLWAPFNKGSGFGPLIDAVLDVPVNKNWGVVFKVGWVSRVEKFTSTHVNPIFYQDNQGNFVQTAFDNKVDLTVSHLMIDLLARYQLVPDSWYLLGGISFTNLLSNSGDFTQTIIAPPGITFSAPLGGGLTFASTSEFSGFNEGRLAVKAGAGTWIPLAKKVFFTPELCIDFPLTKFAKSDGEPLMFVPASDISFMTISLTAGIRFGL
jgi:hypothetical protein